MGEWLNGSAYTYLSARYGVSVEDGVLVLIEEIQDKIKSHRSVSTLNPVTNPPRLFLSLIQVGDTLFV
jgi:hypothetical protein